MPGAAISTHPSLCRLLAFVLCRRFYLPQKAKFMVLLDKNIYLKHCNTIAIFITILMYKLYFLESSFNNHGIRWIVAFMYRFYLPACDDFVPSYILPMESNIWNYKHFDLPLHKSTLIKTFDFSSEHIPHRFLSLLGFTDRIRKFGPDIKSKKSQTIKERPIHFSGHKDTFYLHAYASNLNEYYEQALLTYRNSKSVIEYRKNWGSNINNAKNSLWWNKN